MSIQVRVCSDGVRWDGLVSRSINSTIFHSWTWLRLIERHAGAKLVPLIASRGTNDVAVLPVFTKTARGLTMVFSPPPRSGLTYLGPLIVRYDEVLKQQTLESTALKAQDAFEMHIRETLKPNYTRLTLAPGYVDVRQLKWNHYEITPEYTYVADISSETDAIFENFQKQVRLDIRKSEREGVTFHEGGKRELRQIHKSLEERFDVQGLKTNLTYEYLSDLYDAFNPGNLRVFTTMYRGEFASGFVCVCHQDRASYWAGGGKTSIKGVYPNDLLQWEAMKWAHEQGYGAYEIVDAGDQRLRHFKSKFNPLLKIWFQAEKYRPKLLKHLEPSARRISRIMGPGSLT